MSIRFSIWVLKEHCIRSKTCKQKTEWASKTKCAQQEREREIGEVILHGTGRKFGTMVNCAPKWNKTRETVWNETVWKETQKNGSWKKKKSITEPCVLPKFIQFTRIVCNDDDDSHLVCVWLGRALHKSASCIQTRNDMERVEFWTAHKNTMCKSIDCPPPPIPRNHWSQEDS